jgi:uncharacterized protein YjbI with pentapeptide repeats
LNLDGIWLWRTKLKAAKMLGASLKDANLCWAQMQDVGLTGAHMQRADLSGANLHGARLMQARLQDADLSDANLQQAYLGGANLRRTKLDGTKLQGASFTTNPIGEHMTPAYGVTQSQLANVVIDGSTKLPEGMYNELSQGKQHRTKDQQGGTHT